MRIAKELHIGVVSGEKSGDIIGASIIKALRARVGNVRFSGVGGTHMVEAGLEPLASSNELAVLGFLEPIKRLPRLLRLRRRLRNYFLEQRVHLFLSIDAPDFNLNLAHHLRKRGICTVHCVSPSVWAWRSWRIKQIRKSVNLMMTLFPFEAAFYREHNVPAHCIGHPLADVLKPVKNGQNLRPALGLKREGTLVALLPGSRRAEVRQLGGLFLEAAARCAHERNNMRFVVALAHSDFRKEIKAQLDKVALSYPGFHERVSLSLAPSSKLISASDMVLSASGTAALEIMLLGKPMVISYRMDVFSYRLVMLLSKLTHYSLPNILAAEELVPELLQADATPGNLAQAVLDQIDTPARSRAILLDKFASIRTGLKRDAATTAAEHLCRVLGA
jgi:lipid-A-disaccharide synthase